MDIIPPDDRRYSAGPDPLVERADGTRSQVLHTRRPVFVRPASSDGRDPRRMKVREFRVITSHSADEILERISAVLGEAEFEAVGTPASPLDSWAPVVEEFRAGERHWSGSWAVQVFLLDRGLQRELVIMALGDGIIRRVGRGPWRTVSLNRSLAVARAAAVEAA